MYLIPFAFRSEMTVRGESRVRGRRRAAYRPPLPSGATETDDGVLRRSLPSSESAGRTPVCQSFSSLTNQMTDPAQRK
jgi:hypothetical protein